MIVLNARIILLESLKLKKDLNKDSFEENVLSFLNKAKKKIVDEAKEVGGKVKGVGAGGRCAS